jgi:23S rRNA (uracil1939-C5)-methyltransferase
MKLQIEKMMYGGAGVARQTEGEGAAKDLLVPFTLPGELVEAHLTERKSAFEEASLLKILSASKDRAQPGCKHFGECGGCHYQHAKYRAQVNIKTTLLEALLEPIGQGILPKIQPHTAEQWGYRNRIRMRVEDLEGALKVGYNRRGSNQFLSIQECPISAPLLLRAAESLLAAAADNNSADDRWTRNISEVEFFTTADEKKLQMTLFVRKNQPGFAKFCDQMKHHIPELIGAGTFLVSPKAPQRQLQKPRPLESWGTTGLNYHAMSDDYWVSRGGFFQVNRFLVDELIKIVIEARRGQLAWDLYAGVGLFSRQLAKRFQQVVAVEAAGNDLTNSFRGTGKRAVEATTVEFLRSAVVQRERPELIVMDPPRAGVGAEVCSLLARISAPEIVYVSCDPVTLASDLKILLEAGYNIAALHMVDLFPQTFHLETVVVLRR